MCTWYIIVVGKSKEMAVLGTFRYRWHILTITPYHSLHLHPFSYNQILNTQEPYFLLAWRHYQAVKTCVIRPSSRGRLFYRCPERGSYYGIIPAATVLV
jgi:hypothetical protein